jgi:hypothetical protein
VKRVSVTALMFWAVLSAVGEGAMPVATTKHHAVKVKKPPVHYAPADEYFGPSKMSLLGIRNQLRDLSLQYDFDHDARNVIYRKALFAETSLRDWAKKYSTDPALARDVYLLTHLYGKLDLAAAQKREPTVQHWLLNKYPASWYAKDERKRIAFEKAEKAHPHPHPTPAPSSPLLLQEGSPIPAPSSPLQEGSPIPLPSSPLQEGSPIPLPSSPLQNLPTR